MTLTFPSVSHIRCIDLIHTHFQEIKPVKGRPKHPQSQGCIERGNAPFKDTLSRWMDENQTNDWTLGAYIVNSRINARAIESRANQTPCDLMFGERPKLDDALGTVSQYIQTEQGLLGVTELLKYFLTKLPHLLVGDHDLHIMALTCDELHEQLKQLKTQEEIEAFDVEGKRRSRITYFSKIYLGYDSEEEDASASGHIHRVIGEKNDYLIALYGEHLIPQYPKVPRLVELQQGTNDDDVEDNLGEAGEAEQADESHGAGESEQPHKQNGAGQSEEPDKANGAGEQGQHDESNEAGESEQREKTNGAVQSEEPDEANGPGGSEQPNEVDGAGESEQPNEASVQVESEQPINEANVAVESEQPNEQSNHHDDAEGTTDTEEDDNRAGKLEMSRKAAVLSQIQQAERVNKRLARSIKDPLEAGDIARVEDGKMQKKAIVMVAEAILKKSTRTGITYYRYKVCSRYGYIEKTFHRNQLLHDEHLTATVWA